jgi:hypothetical protein
MNNTEHVVKALTDAAAQAKESPANTVTVSAEYLLSLRNKLLASADVGIQSHNNEIQITFDGDPFGMTRNYTVSELESYLTTHEIVSIGVLWGKPWFELTKSRTPGIQISVTTEANVTHAELRESLVGMAKAIIGDAAPVIYTPDATA